jgi:uncharacterized membrane protein YphA (DoxX/SURF4 family)
VTQEDRAFGSGQVRLQGPALDQAGEGGTWSSGLSSDRSKLLSALMPVALVGARLLVGAIFLIAGLSKVGSPGAFADAVRAYHILPPELVLPFALVIPWLELLAALYLLAGFMARLAAAGTAIMLGGFVYGLTDALARGNTAHACGCFVGGVTANPVVAFLAGGNTITWWDVIRDLLLLGLSILVVVRGAGPVSVDALLARRRERASAGDAWD